MKSQLDAQVDAAWQEFILRHPYAGKTHEVVFRFAYYKALRDLAATIHNLAEIHDDDIPLANGYS